MTGLALRLKNADDFAVEGRADDERRRRGTHSASASADQRGNDTSSEEDPTHEWIIQPPIARSYSAVSLAATLIPLARCDGKIPASSEARNVINSESAIRRSGA